MESKSEKDSSSFKEFLEEFCQIHQGPIQQGSSLPFRLTTCYLTEAEIEGECLDWSLQYLQMNGCPCGLAPHLANAVYEKVKQVDFTQYHEEVEDNPILADSSETSSHEPEVATANSDNKDQPVDDSEKLPPRLDADKFARAVFSVVNEVCEKWRTELPVLPQVQHKLDTSVHAVRNRRRKMEDKHVVMHDLNALFGLKNQPAQSYYAVFDGHGGTDAAVYAAAHLHCNLVRHKAFNTDVATALKEAFRQTDTDFVCKAERENLHSGTTGVCALVREKQIYVAWLGDSQALLVREGRPVEVMNPHKPEREDEKQRIENLGGCVVWFGAWRVNGSLSVSRAIGDADHKPYVSGEPDLNVIPLDGSEEYLVLACDGLWDTVNSMQLTAHVSEHLSDNAGDRSAVAHKLVKIAAENGSNDNISVIVVFLHDNDNSADNQDKDFETEKIDASDGHRDLSRKDGDKRGEKDEDEERGDGEHEKEKKQQTNSERQMGSGKSECGESSEDSTQESSQNSMMNLNLSGQGDSSNDAKNDISQSDSQKPAVSSEDSDNSMVNKVTVSPIQSGGEGDEENSPTQSGGDRSDLQSDTSGTDLALLSKTAARCVNNRKAKRTKANRNGGHFKENRRTNRGRLGSSGLLHYRSPGVPPRSRSAESNLAQAQRNMLRSGDQIFEMITGCSPHAIRKAKQQQTSGKWTVAVEMENASHMFDRSPVDAISRRRSDTPIQYQKK